MRLRYRAMAMVAFVVVVVATAGAAWFISQTPATIFSDSSVPVVPPFQPNAGVTEVTVGSGQSARSIGRELQQKGVIRSARLFEVLVGVTGVQNSLQAGDYEFDPGLPAIEVVSRIAQGKTASREVLIPEGRRVEEIGDLLERAGVVSKQDFLSALGERYDEPFLEQTKLTGLEGFLFPATYSFHRDPKAHDVVDTMLRAFQEQVVDKVQLEGQELTLDQVVILASIVEREAANATERPLIASVFLNRLRLGIALQADPTVQYAIAPGSIAGPDGYWKKDLSVDDLKLDSPYNTYANAGLPPGPIASPGLDAVQAVVRPASTNFLFFVAKNDGTGSHAFAETLDEHLRNVEKYQQ